MPKKGKEEEEAFYVGIEDPIEVRRSILESSKEAVQYLQRAEKFKALRTEKAEQISKLKRTIKELKSLARKLKAALPKTKLRAILHEREKRLKKEAVVKKKVALETAEEKAAEKGKEEAAEEERKKGMTELERLEAELSAIESKLTKLS